MRKILNLLSDKNLLIALLAICFTISLYMNLEHECEKDLIETVIPEKEGSFEEVVNPVPDKKEDKTDQSPTYKYKIKKVTVEVENPLNKLLVERLNKMNDSVQLLHAYIEAITVNKYTQPFEDNLIKATVRATTTGTLDQLSLDYVIKEQKVPIEVPVKKQNKFLIGAAIGNKIEKDFEFKPVYRGDLNYQTHKGDIYSLEGYSNGNVMIGYKTVLFK